MLIRYLSSNDPLAYLFIGLNFLGSVVFLFKIFQFSVFQLRKKATLHILQKFNALGSEKLAAKADEIQLTLERGLFLLRLLSLIFPLIGLLGTVLGIQASFEELAQSGGAGNSISGLISGHLARALITTIIGIGLAIPYYIAYFCLISYIDFQIPLLKNRATLT